MPFSITVDASQVIQLLTRLSQGIASDIPTKAFTAAAEQMVSGATSIVPVLTGNLRDSISAGQASANGVEIVAEAEYAAYVELGTSKMNAQPYMRPSIPEAINALVNTAIQEIESVLG